MLSNYLLNQQKIILIKDQLGIENAAEKVVKIWLHDGKGPDAKLVPVNDLLANSQFLYARVSKLVRSEGGAPKLFKYVHRCKRNEQVQYLFLWATVKNIPEAFVVPYLEYQSEQIVTLEDERHLSILVKKSGGSVSNKRYQYQMQEGSFSAKEWKGESNRAKEVPSGEPPSVDPASLVSFTIGDPNKQEQERLKPYEFFKKNPEGEGLVLYHPDAEDDLDEEDPDDDLLI